MEENDDNAMTQAVTWLDEQIPLEWDTMGLIFGVVLATAIIDFIVRHVFIRMERRAEQTDHVWDDALATSSRRPARIAVWLIGLSFAVQLIDEDIRAVIFEPVAMLRNVAIIFLIAWALIRTVRRIEKNVVAQWGSEEDPLDQTTVDAVSKLARIAIIVTAGLVALQTMGVTLTGLLAFGGIGGLALGFAAQDLLSNFFGGLTIYAERPFKVGDWVRSPDREIEGAVETIGWRRTVIRTFDLRPLYVPNSVFNQISLENPSRMLNRRIFETIGVRYDDFEHVRSIVSEIREYLRNHGDIAQDRTMIVNFNSFSDSSLDFFIYCFTKTRVWTEFHAIKESILLRVGEIILEHGAEIAYPTRTLHVPDGLRAELAQSGPTSSEGEGGRQ